MEGFMNEEEIKRTASEDDRFYFTLDQAVDALEDYKKKGMNVYILFRDQKLYSMLDDRDSCYIKVVGEKYETYTRHLEEERRKIKIESLKEEIEALEKIPDWIARGNAIIYPQQEKDWNKYVRARASDLYHGKDLENALQIMESLAKDGDMEKAYKIFEDAGHSGLSESVVLNGVAKFSNKGTLFYKHALAKQGRILDDKDEKYLKELDDKFAQYEKELQEPEIEKE